MSEISSTNHQPAGNKLSVERLSSLDGLRGIAVLSVIAFHTLRVTGHEGPIGLVVNRLQESAWAGVDLFFVLSGFLITGILLDTKTRRKYFITFFARRTLRIFPLYYAVLVIALLLVPFLIGPSRLPDLFPRLLANQFWLWTYTANYLQATGAHTLPGFGHFWSLAIEEQFYWFWPAMVYFLSRKRLFQVCIAVCLFSPVLRLILELEGVHDWGIRQYTFTRLDALLAGAVVSILIREPELYEKLKRALTVAALLSAASLAVIAIRNSYVPYEASETVILGYSCLAVLFASLVRSLATSRGRLSKMLSAPSLCWFGTYSYGIYIFHWPIAQAYRATLEPRIARLAGSLFYPAEFAFIIVAGISAIVAFISFHLFEARFLKLKDHFTYSPKVQDQRPRFSPLEHELSRIQVES